MFKEKLRKNLEAMIYANRRDYKGWKPNGDPIDVCPFDHCCRICRKMFPEWSAWIDKTGKDPTEGNHPCNYYDPEFVRKKTKEVILDDGEKEADLHKKDA